MLNSSAKHPLAMDMKGPALSAGPDLPSAKDKTLFTPGPLTTSLPVKQAMLRDAGSWHFEFNAVVASVRDRILRLAGLSREAGFEAILLQGSGTFGNAASRIEAFMYSQGAYSWLHDPEIDAWYDQQARERDPQTRGALLHQIQQKVYDEAYFMPIWELGFLCAAGPRVAESGIGLIPAHSYSAPFEEVRLKG